MSDALERLAEALSTLRIAAAERAERERELTNAVSTARTRNARTRDTTVAAITQRRTDELRAEEERYATRTRAIEARAESDLAALVEEERTRGAEIRGKAEANLAAAKTKRDETIWVAETVYEGSEQRPRLDYEAAREAVTVRTAELASIESQAKAMIRRYRQATPSAPAVPPERIASATSRPDAGLTMALAAAQEDLRRLRGLRVAGLFRGPIFLLPLALLAGAGAGVAALLRDAQPATLGLGAGAGALATVLLGAVLYAIARRDVRAAWAPLAANLAVGAACGERAIEEAARERTLREAELVATRDREIEEATRRYEPLAEEFLRKRDERLAALAERVPKARRAVEEERERNRAENESLHARRLGEIEAAAKAARAAEEARHAAAAAEADERERTGFERLRDDWFAATERGFATLDALTAADRERYPPWSDETWRAWRPSSDAPDAIRFGGLDVDLAAFEGGLPSDPRLALARPTRLEAPAILAFPHRSSLLVETDAAGRDEALGFVKALLLRLMARVPPSKARLVLVDPIGLGQSFAGFMHLADEMEALVGDRIWTEPRHIETKLTDLTEHMETVIQKYLRNEFDSIEAYNEKAGEIAEPLRYLVLADFPANMTDIAAKRLASILASGPRCGVHTIILRTRSGAQNELPAGLAEEDLRRNAVVVRGANGRFTVEGEEFSRLPFRSDPPPPDELLIELSRAIGRAAKEAGRVEVPFRTIAPKEPDGSAAPKEPEGGRADEWWSESSAKRLRVPLGRSGASKLQYLVLGEGTAQHALIAGKTGSGKSTLLHALVTSIACWYSPDEVEFYLIDFKKGVEFKTYATHRLPHARAVAIESDREFGLSVLQGLDAELKRRGDLFRVLGVQDLAGYRRALAEGRASEPMPRTLLIVDEFQELFVEDDKVAQDAQLLLDRLVRQGRAFGMHVILGSQTLGGAYSIARATMGQMGVRIALQCNEADAQVILGDDNSAARLLSRPGEAIYNDAGGLVEGNSPFQVVWLPEAVRERYLTLAAERAAREGGRPRSTIVFEGNIPADPSANALLSRTLREGYGPTSAALRLWFGDAIAIKDPTAAVLRRQSGAHAIVVGQQDATALSMSAMAIVGAALQRAPSDLRLVVLDGTPADDPRHGALARIAESLPHDTLVVPWRETEEAIRALGDELARRQSVEVDADDPTRQTILLLVHGLQRFRQLRRNEDDFGFGSSDGPPSADRVFATILKEGAPLGLHVVAWCDTVANLQRTLDRAALREFDWRVLFQLSQTDSSTLIDSPAASRLGPQRALLFSEELGTIEKFRPFSFPDEAYLALVRRTLAERSAQVT